MTLAVQYKYINYTVDKLLALALATNYIINYSAIKATTATATTTTTKTATTTTVTTIIIF